MRREYEMTETDLQTLLEACKPAPYIIANGTGPLSPQESVNAAWRALGARMGFDGMTAEPVMGKSRRHFTAIPASHIEETKP